MISVVHVRSGSKRPAGSVRTRSSCDRGVAFVRRGSERAGSAAAQSRTDSKVPAGRVLQALIGATLCAGLILCAAPAGAYEQAPNIMSVGYQFGAGGLSGTGAYNGNNFGDFGLGLAPVALHIRYCIDPTHALGISFEDLRFQRKKGLSSPVAEQYQVIDLVADYFVYFNRRNKTCPYIVLGPGFHRDAFLFSSDDVTIVPAALTLNLGGGLEYFFTRAFAGDGTIRGYYFAGNGGHGLATEVLLGIHLYTGQNR